MLFLQLAAVHMEKRLIVLKIYHTICHEGWDEPQNLVRKSVGLMKYTSDALCSEVIYSLVFLSH